MRKTFRIGRINWIDITLHIIALLSLCIITTHIFHGIRISCLLLTEEEVKLFNDALYSLACGYVGCYLTYMLTVKLKNFQERKRFIWQIQGLEQSLIETWGNYLKNYKTRFELMDAEDFCHDLLDGDIANLDNDAEVTIKKDMYEAGSRCIKEIENTYEKLRIYDAYLSQYEHNCIKYILDGSSFLCENAINGECVTTYWTVKELWYNAFFNCSQAMKALNNSIAKEIRIEEKRRKKNGYKTIRVGIRNFT